MKTTKKLALGLSIASGAFLAAYLMTGDRGIRTKNYIARRVRTARENATPQNDLREEPEEVHYL